MVKKKRGRKPKVMNYYEGAARGKSSSGAREGDDRNEREGEVRPAAACQRQLQPVEECCSDHLQLAR